MTVRLVVPSQSRIVLIGTPKYDDPQVPDLPAVANNVTDLARAFTDPGIGGFAAKHCSVSSPNATVPEIGQMLRRAAGAAQDLLLIYYSGHGLLDRHGQLYLGLARTRPNDVAFTGLNFEALRGVCLESAASNRVVILDCCFSGRAIGQTLGADEGQILAQLDVTGTYTLASVPGNRAALVLPGERNTAFTGRLLRLLREGSNQVGTCITLGDIYRHLHVALKSEGLPVPQQRGTATAEMLGLVRNPLVLPTPIVALPGELRDGLASRYPNVRLGVVNELVTWLEFPDQTHADTARLALHHVAEHDSGMVAAAARSAIAPRAPERFGTAPERIEAGHGSYSPAPASQGDTQVAPAPQQPNAPLPLPASQVVDISSSRPDLDEIDTSRPRRNRGAVLGLAAALAVAAIGITVWSLPNNRAPGSPGADSAAGSAPPTSAQPSPSMSATPNQTPGTAATVKALATLSLGSSSGTDSVAFSPDGNTLAASVQNSTAEVLRWSIASPAGPTDPAPLGQPLRAQSNTVDPIAFSPDGHVLAAGTMTTNDSSSIGEIQLWNATEPDATILAQPLVTGGTPGFIQSMAFSPVGHTLAVANVRGEKPGIVQLWNVTNPAAPASLGKPLTTSSGLTESLVAFSPDGKSLAVVVTPVYGSSKTGYLQLWNVADPANPTPAGQPFTPANGSSIESLAFSPNGRTLAAIVTNNDTDEIQFFDVANLADPTPIGQPFAPADGDTVDSLAFSPNGQILATGISDSRTGEVQLWDLTSLVKATPIGQPLPVSETISVGCLAFSPDGHVLAAGADDSVQLWGVS